MLSLLTTVLCAPAGRPGSSLAATSVAPLVIKPGKHAITRVRFDDAVALQGMFPDQTSDACERCTAGQHMAINAEEHVITVDAHMHQACATSTASAAVVASKALEVQEAQTALEGIEEHLTQLNAQETTATNRLTTLNSIFSNAGSLGSVDCVDGVMHQTQEITSADSAFFMPHLNSGNEVTHVLATANEYKSAKLALESAGLQLTQGLTANRTAIQTQIAGVQSTKQAQSNHISTLQGQHDTLQNQHNHDAGVCEEATQAVNSATTNAENSVQDASAACIGFDFEAIIANMPSPPPPPSQPPSPPPPPSQYTYSAFNRGCNGRNELGTSTATFTACRAACDGNDDCVSFETSDEGACHLSSSCTEAHLNPPPESGNNGWKSFHKEAAGFPYTFAMGGCTDRNEGGIFDEGDTTVTCANRCTAQDNCISFELRPSDGRCQLSHSCTTAIKEEGNPNWSGDWYFYEKIE